MPKSLENGSLNPGGMAGKELGMQRSGMPGHQHHHVPPQRGLRIRWQWSLRKNAVFSRPATFPCRLRWLAHFIGLEGVEDFGEKVPAVSIKTDPFSIPFGIIPLRSTLRGRRRCLPVCDPNKLRRGVSIAGGVCWELLIQVGGPDHAAADP